ncbi:MAG: hypothetical protein HC882_04475, partial [Acidobacteria bacterium]|nr:hypothetical protein [Acidobacteriota bacterium]
MLSNATQLDTDGDLVGNSCDNCPLTPNRDQRDTNGNGTGDACEGDFDEDGVPGDDGDGSADPCTGGNRTACDDNCPSNANADQSDLDGDGIGDLCDTDRDGDGVLDINDNCDNVANATQLDADNDGIGNVCETIVRVIGGTGVPVYGEDASDSFGKSGVVGDFNNDGTQDLAVGAPFADGPLNNRANAGAVYILYGPIPAGVDLANIAANVEIYGQDAGDEFGFALAKADLNDDNKDDLIVGAPGGDGQSNGILNSGQVHVFYGGALAATIDLSTTSASQVYYGDAANDRAGESVLGLDVDANSKDDLVIGAPNAWGEFRSVQNAGVVYVIKNARLGTFTKLDVFDNNRQSNHISGADASDRFGAVLHAIDLDADSTLDIVGAAIDGDGSANNRLSAGEIYLINNTTLNSRPDLGLFFGDYRAVFYGSAENQLAGSSLASGDTNADGARTCSSGHRVSGRPQETRRASTRVVRTSCVPARRSTRKP